VALMKTIMPLFLYLSGLALLFIGERMFGPGYSARLPLDIVAGLALLAALGLRFRRWQTASGETQRVLGKVLPAYLGGVVALILYAICAEGSTLAAGSDADTLVIVTLLFFIVLLISTLPLVFMEMSLISMYGAQRLETRRVVESGQAGLALGLAISFVFAINFVANEHDERFDLRTIRDLQPSAATQELVRNLSEPVTISLFFSPASDVEETISPYFATLADASELLTVRHRDKAANPKAARELRVRKDGTVVLSDGENHESLQLGEDPGRARTRIKKLDQDFQEKLNKITRSQRIAYFTIGHGERTTAPKSKDTKGLKHVKKGLKALNYKVKNLGVKQGLSDQIPDDATLVFVVGPQGPMIDTEQEALIRYVKGGGALFLLLDPDVEEDPAMEPLLSVLGLRVSLDVLAHETRHVTRDRAISDRSFLASNRFTSHASTTHLSKGGPRLFTLFDGTGSLEKIDDPVSEADVTFTIRTAAGTWADLDGGLTYDKDTEKKTSWNLTAAVQLPAEEGSDALGGRAVVSADADALSDLVLSVSMGNRQWLSDGLRWLENEVKLGARVAELEDVALVHTKDEDKLWFYSTTLGVPLLVLGFGLGLRARRRRRSMP
jgi:hypothetical protein